MNIDIAIAGFILTGAGFALKIIAEIKSELRQCYEREAFQNQKIESCLHQIDLLEYKIEGSGDSHAILAHQLKQGIEHARKRLFEEIARVESKITQGAQQFSKEIARVESKITQSEEKLGEIAKIVYQKQ